MRHLACMTGAIFLIFSTPALAQPKEYALNFKAPPQKGWKMKVTETEKLKIKFKLVKDKKVMLSESEAENASFTYTREILEVSGIHATREKYAFEKAVHVEDGVKVSYGFENKVVVATTDLESGTTFAYEDGTGLSEEDLEGIKKVKSGRKPGQKTGDELLNPEGPVKPGSSWKPDVKTVAMDMLELSGEEAIDLKKSSAKISFLKARQEEGALFATIKGSFKLHVREIGEMKLLKTILTRITMKGDICADGTRPDGTMEMKMTIKGVAPMDVGPNDSATLQMDMVGEMTKKVTLIEAAPAEEPKPPPQP